MYGDAKGTLVSGVDMPQIELSLILQSVGKYKIPVILAFLILIGSLIRVWFALQQSFFYDEGVWLYKALAITKGAVLYSDLGDTRPPLFHYILSTLLRLPGLEADVQTLMIVRSILGVTAAFVGIFVYRIGEMLYGKWVGVLAMALWMIEPQLIVHNTQVEGEAFALFLVIIGYYFLLRGEIADKPDLKNYLPSGIFLTAAVFTHSLSVVAVAPAGVYFLVSRIGLLRYGRNFRDRFAYPVGFLILGVIIPIALIILSLVISGNVESFITASIGASSTVETFDLPVDKKAEHLQEAILEFSLATFWFFAGLEIIRSLASRRSIRFMIPFWFVGGIVLMYFLPQTPGFPINYSQAYPAMVILAASGVWAVVILLQGIRLQKWVSFGLQGTVLGTVLGVTVWNYTMVAPQLGDPFRRITITTEPLNEQEAIAAYLRENTNHDDQILTLTTSLTFMADREAINHFTFGPNVPDAQVMHQTLTSGDIEYVLMDPRTEFRLNDLYPSQPMGNLNFSTYIKLDSPEDARADGVNVLFKDEKNRIVNLWVHSFPWDLPSPSADVVHYERIVIPGIWTRLDFDVSSAFRQGFGELPSNVELKLVANGNGGSGIDARVQWVTMRNGGEMILVDDFEAESSHLWEITEGEERVPSLPGELRLFASNENLTISSTDTFGQSPYYTVGTYYRPQEIFTIHRHKLEPALAPVTLWKYFGLPKTFVEGVEYEQISVTEEFLGDDEERDSAITPSKGAARKLLDVNLKPAALGRISILLQENGTPPPLEVKLNGSYAGEFKSLGFANSSYTWRNLYVDTSLLKQGRNSIEIVSSSDESNGFWRVGSDTDSSGNSLRSLDGFTWEPAEGEVMARIGILHIEKVTDKGSGPRVVREIRSLEGDWLSLLQTQ